MKKEIIWSLTWFANRVSETTTYTNWSDEFCRKEIQHSTDIFIDSMKRHFDWDNLTVEDAMNLRFQLWDEETPDLYLIPLYLLPILPIGMEVTSISGEKIINDGANLDNDIRFGCIAYGITIPKRRESKEDSVQKINHDSLCETETWKAGEN